MAEYGKVAEHSNKAAGVHMAGTAGCQLVRPVPHTHQGVHCVLPVGNTSLPARHVKQVEL